MQWEEPEFYEVHLDADVRAYDDEPHTVHHEIELGGYAVLDLDASSLAHALA
jgi:preprotein translocase subunit SecB